MTAAQAWNQNFKTPRKIQHALKRNFRFVSSLYETKKKSKLKMRWNKHVLVDKCKLKWQKTGLFHSMEYKKRGRDI